MWVSKALVDLFQISKSTVDDLKDKLQTVTTERDMLKNQLTVTEANFNWFRLRVNALELERAQLLEKAYGVKVPVPEVVRTPAHPVDLNASLFEDIGDPAAKELGLPSYN